MKKHDARLQDIEQELAKVNLEIASKRQSGINAEQPAKTGTKIRIKLASGAANTKDKIKAVPAKIKAAPEKIKTIPANIKDKITKNKITIIPGKAYKPKMKFMQSNTFRAMLVLAIMWTALYLGMVVGPALTAYVTGEFTLTEYVQDIDWTITGNQTRTWEMAEYPPQFNLKGVRLNGMIQGEGRVKAYLESQSGIRYLILDSNSIDHSQSLTTITGFIVNPPENETNSDPQENLTEDEDGVEESQTEPNTSEENTDEENTEEAAAEEEEEEEKIITIDLTYNTGTVFDADDDGEAHMDGDAIDLTVEDTVFSWDVRESRLCTAWTVQNSESTTTLCHGADDCCALAGISPTELLWDSPLYIYYGRYGATENNTVTAQVVYLDQNIEVEDVHFDSAQSSTASLKADFITTVNATLSFDDECIETCNLPDGLNTTSYDIVFVLEEGTKIEIDSITYHLERLNTTSEASVDVGIKDSKGRTMAATIEFVGSDGKVKNRKEVQGRAAARGRVQGLTGASTASESSEDTLTVGKGRYKVRINFTERTHPVKGIEIDGLEVDGDAGEFIKVDDVNETGKFRKYAEVYAVDPTAVDFTSAEVTVTATGNKLYKCANWSFEAADCLDDEWVFLQDIVPGETYTFTLTPDDPGLAESNGTFFEGFESGSLDTNNWTTSGAGEAWYVEATNPYAGTYPAKTKPSGAESIMETGVNTEGYQDINFSFYAETSELDSGEYIAADWYNGTDWINLMNETDIASYTLYSYTLPSTADNNADLKIRFRGYASDSNEKAFIDNVQVTGTVNGTDTTDPVISAISDTPDPVTQGNSRFRSRLSSRTPSLSAIRLPHVPVRATRATSDSSVQ
ncbi:hypothetical protein KY362_06940 [Candidatus Woesearchaeota archaeon]|nr:hypothetical protein [Candidatus Woesearchaeota archaeon]